MRRSAELEERLKEWAGEYAGGQYEQLGYASRSWLANMIDYQGPSPQGLNPKTRRDRTPADLVEEAVRSLEQQRDGFQPARILRAEYWMCKAPLEVKMQALQKIGINVSRTKYFDCLWIARTHVAAWLRIPASVELPTEAA